MARSRGGSGSIDEEGHSDIGSITQASIDEAISHEFYPRTKHRASEFDFAYSNAEYIYRASTAGPVSGSAVNVQTSNSGSSKGWRDLRPSSGKPSGNPSTSLWSRSEELCSLKPRLEWYSAGIAAGVVVLKSIRGTRMVLEFEPPSSIPFPHYQITAYHPQSGKRKRLEQASQCPERPQANQGQTYLRGSLG